MDDDYIEAVRAYIETRTGVFPTKNIDLEHVHTARKWAHGLESRTYQDMKLRKSAALIEAILQESEGSDGDCTYHAFYKGKKIELKAPTSYAAQKKAAEQFKERKSYDVTVKLVGRADGSEVTHVAEGFQHASSDTITRRCRSRT